MPERIALIIPTLDQSGAEKQLTLLAAHLPKDDFECRVIALTRGGPYERVLREAEISTTILGKRWKFDPWAYQRLKAELRSFQPGIIHSWLFAANTYARYAASVVPQAKVVISERCVDSWKAGWQTWIDKRLIPMTDVLVGNSTSVVEFYRHLGVPGNKLACIPNGIELPVVASGTDDERISFRRNLGFPEDAFVVGYVGRLAQQKAVQDIIWAIETLRQIRPQCRLVIAGDGPERALLEQMVRDIHADDHVRFLGHVSQTTSIYQSINAFCLASYFEGMSNSLLEAMSYGLPCIVSDIPANQELVCQEETGLLFKKSDTIGLMQGLRRLVDEPSLGCKLGQSARTEIEQKYSIAQMVSRWIDLYRNVRQFTSN